MGFNSATQMKPAKKSSADATPLLGKKEYPDSFDKRAYSSKPSLGRDEIRSTADDSSKITCSKILQSVIAFLVTAAALITSILSIISSPAIVVYLMGGVCALSVIFVACNQWRILLSTNFTQKSVDETKRTAELFEKQNSSLDDDLKALTTYSLQFLGIEQELQDIVSAQGSTIEKCLELVRLNDETLSVMRENLRRKVLQDVIEVLIRRNISGNQGIDRVEARLIALKITVKLESYGVTLDEEKFLQAVALNPTLIGIIGILKGLLPRSLSKVYEYGADSLGNSDSTDDMFYMSRSSSNQTGSTMSRRHEFMVSHHNFIECRSLGTEKGARSKLYHRETNLTI